MVHLYDIRFAQQLLKQRVVVMRGSKIHIEHLCAREIKQPQKRVPRLGTARREGAINKVDLVVEDFFECYHLNDVREILWKWTVAIVSSPGNISSEPLERSNHIYFYEKMEALVEATYMLLNQINEQLNKTVVVTPGN